MEDNNKNNNESNRRASTWMFVSAISAIFGAMNFGCVVGWSAPALVSMERNFSHPRIDPNNSADLQYKTWVSSSVTLGAMVGSLLSGIVIQYLGSRKTLAGLGIPFLAGWAMICYANTFMLIIVGRTLTGLCVGITCSASPTYVGDVSTPKTRGFLGTCFQLFVCVGQLFMMIMSLVLEWNGLCYVAIVPCIISSVGMVFAPETPISLMESGNETAARHALKRLRQSDSDIEAELDELRERTRVPSESNSPVLTMITRPDVYHPAIIAVALMFFQQFSGINAVGFYLVGIFKGSGSSLNPTVTSILVMVPLVFMLFISGLLIDRLGRRTLLIISGLGSSVVLSLMGFYYWKIMPNCSWIPAACVLAFFIMFSLGFGPIPWMIISELTPNEAIRMISALGTASNWLFAFIITKEFESLIDVIHEYGVYWLFAGFSLLSMIYTIVFVPETKGRTIEDIQKHFLTSK